MLTLSKALSEDRLEEFIQQQEAAGIEPIRESDFNRLSEKVIKSSPEEDQTLRSPSRGGSSGK